MELQSTLKALMVTSSYPRSDTDSAAVFLRYLAEHLQRLKVDVHVLVPSDNNKRNSPNGNIPITRFRYLPLTWQKLAYGSGILPNLRRHPLLWLQVPFYIAGMTFSLLRLVRKLRPHVIHAHWILPQGAIALFVGRLTRTPVIVTLHGSDAHSLRGPLLGAIKRYIVTHSNAWTANSRHTASAINVGQSASDRLRIIPMGINIEDFQRAQTESGQFKKKDSTRWVVLFIGRLIDVKGVRYLIEAFSRLPASIRDITELWIVGDGTLRAELEGFVNELNAKERIRFFGNVPHDQIPRFFASADLFVGPSIKTDQGDEEGQGIVFLEAFAAKCCVLATTSGGIPEVVENGRTGVLVPPKDSASLASAIERLLPAEQLRNELTENAFRMAADFYAWKTIAGKFNTLYQSVLTTTPEK